MFLCFFFIFVLVFFFFFFSSRRRHTRSKRDWSSDVCSSDLFSFGLTVTMREAEFAAPLVREYLEGKRRNGENPFAEHQVFCEKGIDNLEDMIDLFWEQPFAFATFVYHRYPDQLTDAFAGRIYPTEHQPSPAVVAFRKMLK